MIIIPTIEISRSILKEVKNNKELLIKKPRPDKTDLIQNTICIPYTTAILNSSYHEVK
ncbi:MAG: hypothetical protein ACFFE5_04240 [Candidatus Thorarchaeota archaeon]